MKNLPHGVRFVETGDTEFMNELVVELCDCRRGRRIDGVRGAGTAVCASLSADHHSVGIAAVAWAGRSSRCS